MDISEAKVGMPVHSITRTLYWLEKGIIEHVGFDYVVVRTESSDYPRNTPMIVREDVINLLEQGYYEE